MRILWVRHSPTVKGRVNRDSFLIPRLATRHEIQIVTWETRETVAPAWRMLLPGRGEESGTRKWTLPRFPRPPGWPKLWRSVNDPIFRISLRLLERSFEPDAVVVGPSWTQMGKPPALRAVRVFDWLDGAGWDNPRWRAVEGAYLTWSDAVVAVSDELGRRVEEWRKPCEVVPNGVEVDRLISLRAQRTQIRTELGLQGRRVVSLIGLTAADDLYWVEAIRVLTRSDSAVLFAAVGRGPLASLMERLAAELGNGFRWVGPVSYEEAQRWFVVSDVTWYPGCEIDYFHLASPLKIFEGLAAGAQVVVAPQLRSLAKLEHPSLHFAKPTAPALVDCTLQALALPPVSDALNRQRLAPYSWDSLAERVSQFLIEQVERKRRSSGPH